MESIHGQQISEFRWCGYQKTECVKRCEMFELLDCRRGATSGGISEYEQWISLPIWVNFLKLVWKYWKGGAWQPVVIHLNLENVVKIFLRKSLARKKHSTTKDFCCTNQKLYLGAGIWNRHRPALKSCWIIWSELV